MTSDTQKQHKLSSKLYLDDILKDGVPEVQPRFLVKLFPVNDPHLFEKCGFAALAGTQQQDLHQTPHRASLAREHGVDLTATPLRLALLVDVAFAGSFFTVIPVIVRGLSGQKTPAQGAHHASHPLPLRHG